MKKGICGNSLHKLQAVSSWLVLAAFVGAAAAAEPASMPLLMPDDFSQMELVAWRVEPGTLDAANPLLEGEMPWDSGGVGIHGSVFKDPLDGKWKAYLVCTPPEVTSENSREPWASRNDAMRRMCLYESTDGVHWIRPELTNIPFRDYKATNIIFDLDQGTAAYASVMIDPSNPDTPYQIFVLREGNPPGGRGYYRYRSRDGYAWEQIFGPITEPMKGDLCFFYRVGQGDYVAYYRIGGKKQPMDHVPVYEDAPRRTVYRATSSEGNTWTRDDVTILTADERDHRDTQYQELIPHEVKDGYLGMVTMFNPILQTFYLRIAASRDGRRWWYPDRRPCLDNAPLGDYGGGMIWQSQNLIVEGDRLYVYYGGTEGPHRQISDTRAPSKQIGYLESVIDHGRHFLPFNAALCRAYWKLGRMYALIASAGGPTPGIAVTKSRDLGDKTLWVNMVTRPAKKSSQPGFDEGFMQVELLDSQDKPIPGFELTDCARMKGDHDALQVTWTGGDKAPKGAQKAKFYLKRTFLYGFEFRQ